MSDEPDLTERLSEGGATVARVEEALEDTLEMHRGKPGGMQPGHVRVHVPANDARSLCMKTAGAVGCKKKEVVRR